MQQTSYHRAGSVPDAVAALKAGSDAKYISGGQTLLPTMKQRLAAPSDLIDLRHVGDMKGIEVSGDLIRIGGGCTHYEVSTHSGIQAACPGLAELAGLIGDMAVRHMGTIGGSIANNDPAADYPAACLALDAVIETDRRELAAPEFFTGMFETALADDEIVTAVRFKVPRGAAYEKFRNPASRYAMAGAFVARHGDEVRVAISGAGADGVFRWTAAEDALEGGEADALAGLELDPDNLLGDLHASADYRAHLVKVMAMRAAARAGAGGGPNGGGTNGGNASFGSPGSSSASGGAEDHTAGQIGDVPGSVQSTSAIMSGTAGGATAQTGMSGASSEVGASAQTSLSSQSTTSGSMGGSTGATDADRMMGRTDAGAGGAARDGRATDDSIATGSASSAGSITGQPREANISRGADSTARPTAASQAPRPYTTGTSPQPSGLIGRIKRMLGMGN